MFQFAVLILTLASGFTVAQKKQLLCKSDDLEILYSICDSSSDTFYFQVEPCSLKSRRQWMGNLFWIPKADLTILNGYISLWHANTKVLQWKTALCSGVDDEFSFCGALKGETINTTVRIKSAEPVYPTGEYTAIFKGYRDAHLKEELIFCMNYTLILKKLP